MAESNSITEDGTAPTLEEQAEAAIDLEPGEGASDVSPEEEVALRSPDQLKPSLEHVKVFVLGPGEYTEAAGYDHEANKIATRQYAIDAGLWPTGDVRHVSTKKHADGKSKVLTYTVPVIPAHAAPDAAPTPEVSDGGNAEAARDADPAQA